MLVGIIVFGLVIHRSIDRETARGVGFYGCLIALIACAVVAVLVSLGTQN